MLNRSSECLTLARDSLSALQNPKIRTSASVRKLQVIAGIIRDGDLNIWCDFHFGNYSEHLPAKNKEEGVQEYLTRIESKLHETQLDRVLSKEELTLRILPLRSHFESIEDIEQCFDEAEKGCGYRDQLHRIITSCRNAAAKHSMRLYSTFAFGDIPSRYYDVIRERVDRLLRHLCPEAVEKFISANNQLSSSMQEDWSLALTACRRVIKAVADTLYPPSTDETKGRKLGEEQYINRLWAFLDQHVSSDSDKALGKAHVDYLGSFLESLHDKACKGVHANVSHDEAIRSVLYTYLTIGDILEFAGAAVQQRLSASP